MADSDYKINISTAADIKGVETLKTALDDIEDGLRKVENEQLDDGIESAISSVRKLAEEVRELSGIENSAGNFDEHSPAADDYREKIVAIRQELENLNIFMEGHAPTLGSAGAAVKKDLKVVQDSVKEITKSEKSLKRIEKLQTAQALGQMAKSAKRAGEGFADLGKEGASMGDDMLSAAESTGDLASSMLAAQALMGPIGLVIAAVSAAIGFFTARNKEAQKALEEAFGPGVTENVKLTKEQIYQAAEAAKEYTKWALASADAVERQLNSIERARNAELERAKTAAEIAGLDNELERLNIVGNDDLTKPEKVKALAQLKKKSIRDAAVAEIEAIRATTIALKEKQAVESRALAEALKKRNSLRDDPRSKTFESNNADAKEGERRARVDFNRQKANVTEFTGFATTDFAGSILSNNEYEDLIDAAVKKHEDGGDTSDPAYKEFYESLKSIAEKAKKAEGGKLDFQSKRFLKTVNEGLAALERIENAAAHYEETNNFATQRALEIDTANKKVKEKTSTVRELDRQSKESESREYGRISSVSTIANKKFRNVNTATHNKLDDLAEAKAKKADSKKKTQAQQDDSTVTELGNRALAIAKNNLGKDHKGVAAIETVLAQMEDGQSNPEREALGKLIDGLGKFLDRKNLADKSTLIRLNQMEKKLLGIIKDRQ